MLESKETTIAQLNQKVGELTSDIKHLKETMNFISEETTNIRKDVEDSRGNHEKTITDLKMKTQDLEDRGRRNNIVVYGVPEVAAKLSSHKW